MLDPLTALALTGNVLQFIDFGLKATSKARDIYLSADGVTAENADLEVLTTDITSVSEKLVASSGNSSGNDSLDDISRRCKASADDLLVALGKLKVEGRKGKWKSARKGLKAVWGKRKVDDLQARLVGWRNAIQFHVIVQLRNDIDAEALRKSARFDTLDEHAKAILVTISATENTIRQAMVVESDSSEQRHKDTRTAILGEHNETREHIQEAILVESGNAETRYKQTKAVILTNGTEVKEEICNNIRVEGENSSQRHSQTREILVAKQTEARVEITQALDTIDSNLQAEQEATRRELEQLKVAMKQIEKDMARRDEELKILLVELSQTHTEKEKKRLQERSNAVTIALYALITVYEGLQRMLVALQTRAKLVISSTSLTDLWKAKTTGYSTVPESITDARMIMGLLNRPDTIRHDRNPVEYYNLLGWTVSERLEHSLLLRLQNPAWKVVHPLRFKDLNKDEGRLVAGVLDILDFHTGKSHYKDFRELRFGCVQEVGAYDGLVSLIIISTGLAFALGSPSHAATVLWKLKDLTLNEAPSRLFHELDFHQLVSTWATVGQIAGFRDTAERILHARCMKWGINEVETAVNTKGVVDLFQWLCLENSEAEFSFNVVAAQGGRGGGAALFAANEYLIHFGFQLTPPVMEMTPYGLRARIRRYGVPFSQTKTQEMERRRGLRDPRSVRVESNLFRRKKYLPDRVKREAQVLQDKIVGDSTFRSVLHLNDGFPRDNIALADLESQF